MRVDPVELLLREASTASPEDVRQATALLTNRRVERDAENERAAQHADALAACQKAVAKIGELRAEVETANAEYLAADLARENAALRLTDWNTRKPPAYSPTLQTEAYQARMHELQTELDEALSQVKAADQQRGELLSSLNAALSELNKRPGGLGFREQQLRPRQPAEPHYIGGQLSGVR